MEECGHVTFQMPSRGASPSNPVLFGRSSCTWTQEKSTKKSNYHAWLSLSPHSNCKAFVRSSIQYFRTHGHSLDLSAMDLLYWVYGLNCCSLLTGHYSQRCCLEASGPLSPPSHHKTAGGVLGLSPGPSLALRPPSSPVWFGSHMASWLTHS